MAKRGGDRSDSLLLLFVSLCLIVASTTGRKIDVSLVEENDDFSLLPTPPHPILPDSWHDPNVSLGSPIFPILGPIWFDGVALRYRQDFTVNFEHLEINETILMSPMGSKFISNEICRNISDKGLSSSFWSWVPFSTYNGQVFVDGRGPCDEWILKYSGGVLLVDVINGTTPVRFIAPGSGSITSPDSEGNSTFLFSPQFTSATFTAQNDSLFNFPEECFSMGVCPSGPVMNETWFLFHGANDYTLINTNVADELGDVAFVCEALLSQGFGYFNWISEYIFTVNTTFGQYGLCNFGSCLGGASDRVGQEAAEGAAPKGGQCDSNEHIGNWFSLPPYNEMLCPGGGLGNTVYNETVGINGTAWSGCGWKVAEKVKTIDGRCLENHGFVNACLADLGYPWTKAIAMWSQVFSSDDPTNGGCPPIINGTLYEEVASHGFPEGQKSLRLSEDALSSVAHDVFAGFIKNMARLDYHLNN